MLNKKKAIVETVGKNDRISKTRTMYDVSAFEIIWRNFLAGASRAFGSLIFYIIFITIIGSFLLQFFLPKVMPTINKFLKMGDSLEKIQNLKIPNRISF